MSLSDLWSAMSLSDLWSAMSLSDLWSAMSLSDLWSELAASLRVEPTEVIMAGVDVGGAAVRGRAQNAEINMIPFIDLLFMITAFLLITAVWSTNASLPANADIPGANEGVVDTSSVPKMLHLYNDAGAFRLAWKRGDVVLSETTIEKRRVDGSFPDLADAIEKTWKQEGEHRDPADLKADLVVLHTDDHVAFDEIAASMDAVNRTKRDLVVGGKSQNVAALSVTFSAH